MSGAEARPAGDGASARAAGVRQSLIPLAQLPPLPPLRLAVVGHVEVVTFLRVPRLPEPGAICRASAGMDLPAGGGAVVAVQMARLTGQRVVFFTALGRDRVGEQAAADLEALGLELRVAWREAPTRRGVSWVDGEGERTITVLGERLCPGGEDPLPWSELAEAEGVPSQPCRAEQHRQDGHPTSPCCAKQHLSSAPPGRPCRAERHRRRPLAL